MQYAIEKYRIQLLYVETVHVNIFLPVHDVGKAGLFEKRAMY